MYVAVSSLKEVNSIFIELKDEVTISNLILIV